MADEQSDTLLHSIERWDDATGENRIEEIARVGDYLLAMQTYLAAVDAGLALRSRCATGRGSLRSRGRTSRSTAAQGWRHHHKVRKLRHDLDKKKHDGSRQDGG